MDGSSHRMKKGRDELRDRHLKQHGLNTIRYKNKEILNNIRNIEKNLRKNKPIDSPPLVKGGLGWV